MTGYEFRRAVDEALRDPALDLAPLQPAVPSWKAIAGGLAILLLCYLAALGCCKMPHRP